MVLSNIINRITDSDRLTNRKCRKQNLTSLNCLKIPSIYLTFIIIIINISSTCAIILAGVTIKSSPFINTENNRFTGFCVDLMDLIQEHSGLNYSLYLVEDNTYGPGPYPLTRISGLIGDVYKKKADFAIADMTVTDKRREYVSFTEPFLTFSFSALVRRSLSKRLQTMDDLAIKSNLSIGTFQNGKTMINMQQVRNSILNVRWLYDQLLLNKSNLVERMEEALWKVRNENYAFIQEEPKNQYYSSIDCSLKTLYDQNLYLPAHYAIAMHPESPYLQAFNRSIKWIKHKGHLKRLIKKHFLNSHCNNGASNHLLTNQHLLLCILLIILSSMINYLR